MTANPIERSYSLQDAKSALRLGLDKLGYRYECQSVGNTVHACRCLIIDGDSGRTLASGNGKGEPFAAHVGSLFEATEHLFSEHDRIESSKIVYSNAAAFCRDNRLCETLPLAIVNNSPDATIPFLRYEAVNGADRCLFPLALSCPGYIDALRDDSDLRQRDSFDYRRLEQYASNSGVAIGMNRDEALIHGLLESIERSSLSSLLVDAFVLNKRNHLRVVDPDTFPPDIHEVLSGLESELRSKVMVFEMPNKVGIPAYCSWMEQSAFDVRMAGHGCSLSLEHAILRSMYEVAQYYLLSTRIFGSQWLRALDDSTLSPLHNLPLHQDCARFDLGSKCKQLGYQSVCYSDLPAHEYDNEASQYLRQLTDIIYASGEVPFASEINTIGEDIVIAHSFVTGEDRFFTVRLGKSAFPISLT